MNLGKSVPRDSEKESEKKMDLLKKAAIREVRLSWGGGGSPPQKNFFVLLFVDFLFTQVIKMTGGTPEVRSDKSLT